jgi:hypothetical protein
MGPEADPGIQPRPARSLDAQGCGCRYGMQSHWIDRIRRASGLLGGDAEASVRAALTAAEPKANLVQRP